MIYDGLLAKPYYQSGINFKFSTNIREYDISKANISILRQYNAISDELYQELLIAPRDTRQIKIGLLEKSNAKVVKILQNGIIEAKRKFLQTNHINPSNVLCIKNDAIFIINQIPTYTKFDLIEFKCKNLYTSYMNIFNIELYYSFNRVEGTDRLDIKGLGKNNIKYHEKYMIDFLLYIFNIIETDTIENAIRAYKNFYNSFINLELDIGYYRNFNSSSNYSIMNSSYQIYHINDNFENKRNLNISYNMNFLREIYRYLATVFFNKK